MTEFERFDRNTWSRGVLIDTNLFVLFIVGSVERDRISRFKRTQAYTPADWDLLTGLIGQIPRRYVVAHVLAEVSSLTDMKGADLATARQILRRTISLMEEIPVPSLARMRIATLSTVGLDRRCDQLCSSAVRLLRADERCRTLCRPVERRCLGRSSMTCGRCYERAVRLDFRAAPGVGRLLVVGENHVIRPARIRRHVEADADHAAGIPAGGRELRIQNPGDLVSRAFEMRAGLAVGGLGERRGARGVERAQLGAVERLFVGARGEQARELGRQPGGYRLGAVHLVIHQVEISVLQVAAVGVDLHRS